MATGAARVRRSTPGGAVIKAPHEQRFASPRGWKKLIAGLAVAGLSVAGIARTEPPCAYVLGRAGTTFVATPAVVVFVSEGQAGEQPWRVHLDDEGPSIRGYSLRAPGEDAAAGASKVFVSGLAQVAHAVSTLGESGTGRTCENLGVSTPAIPIHVPTSAFERPGALVETPNIMLQLPDRVGSAPGHVLSLGDSTVVLPMQRLQESAPSWPVAEPTLSVDIGGEPRTTHFLAPRVSPGAPIGSLSANSG